MTMRALRFCAGTLTASTAVLGGVAALAIVALASGPAFAGVTWSGGFDIDTPVIVVQPSTTQVGTVMQPTVTVHVVEPHTSRLDGDFNGMVTLTYAANPDGAPEPENNVARASHGVATFPELTFAAVGFNFTLEASIPHATGSPSSAFDIVSQYITCQAGQACQSGTVSSDGTSGSSVASAGPEAGFLAATASATDCPPRCWPRPATRTSRSRPMSPTSP